MDDPFTTKVSKKKNPSDYKLNVMLKRNYEIKGFILLDFITTIF